MRTIEYNTVNKQAWGAGPWQTECDKRQWLDSASGLPCMIRRAGSKMGHWCGYVGVPKSHPMFGQYGEDLDAHGGITHTGLCSHGDERTAICHVVEDGEDDTVWWFGFDCAHSGDLSPGMQDEFSIHHVYRDQSYVVKETERLAQQLAAAK